MFAEKMAAALILALLLSACASNPEDQTVDWKNGARRAWIVRVYSPATPRAELPECLSNLPIEEMKTKHFVKVEFHHVRQMWNAIAELPDTMTAAVDDQVELWPEDCSQGKISRISRVLSTISQQKQALVNSRQ